MKKKINFEIGVDEEWEEDVSIVQVEIDVEKEPETEEVT